MANKANRELSDIIDEGLKIMYARLLEKAIKEDRELVVSDDNGNPVRVKATELKARLI